MARFIFNRESLNYSISIFNGMSKQSQSPVTEFRNSIKYLKFSFLKMFSSILKGKIMSSLK